MQFISETRFQLADFYAGMAQSTLDIDVKEELRACIVPDEELSDLWDLTVTQVSGYGINDDQWTQTLGKMIDRLGHDVAPCKENGKLRAVGRQLDNWWRLFWNQDYAHDLFDKSRADNKFKITK